MHTQLLCTFCTEELLNETIEKIIGCYEIAFDSIYVLDNVDEPGLLCCTYNIVVGSESRKSIPPSTISLHRKKQTNTLYTINALNKIVAERNDGMADKNFQIDWEDLRNMILVTQYGHLKKIPTKLREIHKPSRGKTLKIIER
jgi:hypothetical protein